MFILTENCSPLKQSEKRKDKIRCELTVKIIINRVALSDWLKKLQLTLKNQFVSFNNVFSKPVMQLAMIITIYFEPI